MGRWRISFCTLHSAQVPRFSSFEIRFMANGKCSRALPGEFRSGAHRARVNPVDGCVYVCGMHAGVPILRCRMLGTHSITVILFNFQLDSKYTAMAYCCISLSPSIQEQHLFQVLTSCNLGTIVTAWIWFQRVLRRTSNDARSRPMGDRRDHHWRRC